MNIIKRI